MFLVNCSLGLFAIGLLGLALRFLWKSNSIHSVKNLWRVLGDRYYVHRFYRVPKFNDNMQENLLYRKVYTYLNTLPSVEDSDFANLFSSSKSSANPKSSEINLILEENQTIVDEFLGSRVQWMIESRGDDDRKSLVMKIRKDDKRRILLPYLQHIHQVFDKIDQEREEVRLFVNVENQLEANANGRWRSTVFTHPATMETIVMDADLKTRIKSDLENFLKSRQYHHRLGRVWKRSYLLYGSAGTGKSTFIAAMAKFLKYDIYEINLHRVANDSDLKCLLLQTTNKSLLVIEDLDRYFADRSTAISLSGILNFMDGIWSSCCEERVMVFTMSSKENIPANILRPGRIDVHIHFPLCDFTAFRSLAVSHLGLKDHKLFSQVEEIFQTGASLSQAEICEIMISNRSSPSRAVKTVITALQADLAVRFGKRLHSVSQGRAAEESVEMGCFVRDSPNGLHPIKNLYGLLRARSRKPSADKLDLDLNNKEKERENSNLSPHVLG